MSKPDNSNVEITVSENPIPVETLVQVSATGCPTNYYLNLNVSDANGLGVFVMGTAAPDGTFGPGDYYARETGDVHFEVRGRKLGPDGYPSGPWKTLASLDATVV